MADDYLHGHHESVLRSHTWRTAENSAGYLVPHLAPGLQVLDIGAGPGTITIDLARIVAPGRVVGIETTDEILATARSNARAADAPGSLSFEKGNVYDLAYDDDTFDVVHAHQVLQHLSDPVAALREMARVCKPGGVIAARDADYGAMTWFPAVAGIGRWQAAYRETAYSGGYYPDAGRMLKSWAQQAGLADVSATGSVWCYASDDEVAWWADLWADRVVHSDFARQALERSVADRDELELLRTAWQDWGSRGDAWFLVPHGEILCRAPG
ncbi:class I SAM-dependent methyltransferase [Cumulibacter manganitolerans]|uniref:class I SAM-dependent methyltransferase n=1 Tax=Cumulibacter manganitolerans TaxID=1884992 RepID=UPI0012969A8F|nr:methyltransferase domain-containing protein [Cumulibacter manganitolerans]